MSKFKIDFHWLSPCGLSIPKRIRPELREQKDSIYSAFYAAFKEYKIQANKMDSDILGGDVINVMDVPLSFIDSDGYKYQVTLNLMKEGE